MIRIGHFSDLHYSAKNLDEADRCFGFAVDEAIRRGIDVAVLSGDATDHALEMHTRRCAQKDGPASKATSLQLEYGAMDLLHVDAGVGGNLLELRQGQRTDIGWNT